MNDTQAAAAALETTETPGPENRLAIRQDWTPEAFRAEVEREKQMRNILATYMKEAMVAEHHYYSFQKDAKPALTQEGAHSICSLMKCVIGPPDLHETFHGDGHYTVRARVDIFNQAGERVATGDGSCSTQESKYAYRWYWSNELLTGIDRSKLKTRGKDTNPQYQLPNQDLPDLHNTVLKMAVKRAKVAGVRCLPLVSELFVAEPDGEPENLSPNTAPAKAASVKANKPSPAPPQPTETAVETAVRLAKKLTERGVEPEDLAMQFLPEGVSRFEDLTEEQAAGQVPAMIDLVNAKLREK